MEKISERQDYRIYTSKKIHNLIPEGFAICFIYNPHFYINPALVDKLAVHWKNYLCARGKDICIEENVFLKLGSIEAIALVSEKLNSEFKGKYLYAEKREMVTCKIIQQGKILSEYESLKNALTSYIPTPFFYACHGFSDNLFKQSIINELAKSIDDMLPKEVRD